MGTCNGYMKHHETLPTSKYALSKYDLAKHMYQYHDFSLTTFLSQLQLREREDVNLIYGSRTVSI